jgi:Uma2 family endonuclease
MTPSAWVSRFTSLIRPGGLVLDLAAGAGRHTRLLLDRGYRVRAVDREVTALRGLAGPRCEVVELDLETGESWPLGSGYDAIVVTRYLHRPLLPAIAAALAPRGSVIYETFAQGNERFGRPRDPEFLLRPGELLDAFAGLTIVAFEQGEITLPRPAVIQRIAATADPSGRLPVLDKVAAATSNAVMSGPAEKLMLLDEFVAWEREQPERYEYANFVVRMMTGGSLDHSTIASNLRAALQEKPRGTGCLAFRGDAKVIANQTVRYPDLSVTCSPISGSDDIVPDPVVIIEIVSPSTEREDRGRKKFDYFATPSVRQYAIVEQDERRIDLYTRTDAAWIDEVVTGDAVLNLSAVGVAIPLDAIYEDMELDATRRRADGAPAPAA